MRKGSKHSPETIERQRLVKLGMPSGNKGNIYSEESKILIKLARSKQVHPSIAARGITKDQWDEARKKGLRWCCGDCKDFVGENFFSRGGNSLCRDCRAKSLRKWRSGLSSERLEELRENCKQFNKDNPDYEKRLRLLKNYGVTLEWYHETLLSQDGVCALCSSEPTQSRKYFCVDHDHLTGKARGLLCLKCNSALERIECVDGYAERAVSYLKKHGSING